MLSIKIITGKRTSSLALKDSSGKHDEEKFDKENPYLHKTEAAKMTIRKMRVLSHLG